MPETEIKQEMQKISKAEGISLANNLRDIDFITKKQHIYLHEQIHISEKDFCFALLDVYKEKAKNYLKNTQGQLVWYLKKSSALSNSTLERVAQSISIRYVYSALACDDEVNTLFSLINFIEPELAISFGIISPIYSLLKVGIVSEVCQFSPIFDANKEAFIHLISCWKIFKDLGIEKIKQLNLTADGMLYPKIYFDYPDIETYLTSMMQNSINVLKSGWKKYLDTKPYKTAHHDIVISLFNYLADENVIKDVISKTITAFLKEYALTKSRKHIYEFEMNIFNELHGKFGTICGPALNTLMRVPSSKKTSYIEIVREVSSDLLQQHQAIISASGIEEKEKAIKEYQAELAAQESLVASYFSSCRGKLEEAMRNEKHRIRKTCSPGFFVGIGVRGPLDIRGNLNFELSHVSIKTKTII